MIVMGKKKKKTGLLLKPRFSQRNKNTKTFKHLILFLLTTHNISDHFYRSKSAFRLV